MPIAALDAFAEQVKAERFVAFAGAGISAGGPTSLPGWWDLNKAILQALYKRVQREFDIRSDYGRILLEYRDTAQAFPPDYQAQAMEECGGTKYFEALCALDVSHTNRCHRALAALAASNRLAAIITTNFDSLVELALEAAGVPYVVAYDRDGFEQLQHDASGGALPLIKVHGSVKSVTSMIDTRKQRRRGRALALTAALARLLRSYRFLYAGFSGADFNHDRSYLGIWEAAKTSPGFCFLFQPGRPPEKGVYELVEHYGTEKASLVELDAAQALERVGAILGVTRLDEAMLDATQPTVDLVTQRLAAWASGLDHWLALRMAAALQDAASMRVNALGMLRAAWNRRQPDESPQFVLFAADWVRGRLRRARYEDIEMRTAIRELESRNHPLGPYYKFLSDAFTTAHLPFGRGILPSLQDFAARYREYLNGYTPTQLVDATLLMAQVASLFEDLPELTAALDHAREVAKQDGDDVREAACQAELAVRHARAGRYAEAEAILEAARLLANPLRERNVISTLIYANALMYEHKGEFGEAIGAGNFAYEVALGDELRLPMTKALLLQFRAACRHGGPGNVATIMEKFQGSGAGFEHQFWAHELERDLYEAEAHKRFHYEGWQQKVQDVLARAEASGLSWIAREALALVALGTVPGSSTKVTD